MKTNFYNCFHALLLAGVLISPPLVLSACAVDEIQRPEVTKPLMPDLGPEGKGGISLSQVETYTAFTSGEPKANSTRIPAIVTAADGSLLVFCEARHERWKDGSYTDIFARRSTDDGKTWSSVIDITGSINPSPANAYAFMDPTPVVDLTTGKIFMFCTRHNIPSSNETNRAFLCSSSDNGVSWSTPVDVTNTVMRAGFTLGGFGPSSGIQIREGRFKGRLILNCRQSGGGVIIYSDDHGATWKNDGTCAQGTSEATIAEAGADNLIMNIRKSANRYSAFSTDGGISWKTAVLDNGLPSFESGCHASVFGLGNGMVLYCGAQGSVKTADHDNRSYLTIYRSPLGGAVGGWSRKQQLTSLAAGYTDMTVLKDGRVAIAYEAGPLIGFGFYGGTAYRPAGWMRIDVLILPKEVLDYEYWFESDK